MTTARLTNKRILLIHPDATWLKATRSLLRAEGFSAYATRNLGFALEVQARLHTEIVICSVDLGQTRGQDVLNALRHQDPHAVIVVALDGSESENHLAQGSYFSSISLPCDPKMLVASVRESVAFYNEKNTLFQYMQEYQDRVKDQLEWLLWKEQNKHAYKVRYSKALISNVRNTILQGMGLGSLITRMELVELKTTKEGKNSIVPTRDMEQIGDAVHNVHRWLGNMEKISQALDRSFSLEILTPEEFADAITRAAHAVEKFRGIKNHRIDATDLSLVHPLSASREGLEMCVRELLINAFKYSPPDSTVDIVKFESRRSVMIGIINDILPMQGGITGIPEGFELQLYEPFYRMNNVYDERFFDEDFSMGTGLTIVQGTMHQMGGRVFHHEISDHSGATRKRRVMAELILKKATEAGMDPQADEEIDRPMMG